MTGKYLNCEWENDARNKCGKTTTTTATTTSVSMRSGRKNDKMTRKL